MVIKIKIYPKTPAPFHAYGVNVSDIFEYNSWLYKKSYSNA